jgi:signal transduction histidine kinase
MVGSYISEKQSLENRLKMEAEYYLRAYVSSFSAPTSNAFNTLSVTPPYVTYYYGEDILPLWVKASLPITKPGTYFVDHDKQRYCVLIQRLPDGDNFYLLYNVTKQQMDKKSLFALQKTLLLALLPIIVFGVILGLITAKKVIGPVIQLSDIIAKFKQNEKLPEDFDKNFKNDEVGLLATTLKNSINTMQESLEREISFARDASHELRTPVTIIKNSLELINEINPEMDENVKKIIGRITRSTSNMEHLIKSFLWLSRSQYIDSFEKKDVAVSEIVEEIIQENSYLLNNKTIDISVYDEAKATISVDPDIFKILLSNIVRNAFAYTKKGYVDIFINKNCIHICDTGPGIKKEILLNIKNNNIKNYAEGFGLGLAIVRRLCVSLGWNFNLSSIPQIGTRVWICYNPSQVSCSECNTVMVNNYDRIRV